MDGSLGKGFGMFGIEVFSGAPGRPDAADIQALKDAAMVRCVSAGRFFWSRRFKRGLWAQNADN